MLPLVEVGQIDAPGVVDVSAGLDLHAGRGLDVHEGRVVRVGVHQPHADRNVVSLTCATKAKFTTLISKPRQRVHCTRPSVCEQFAKISQNQARHILSTKQQLFQEVIGCLVINRK